MKVNKIMRNIVFFCELNHFIYMDNLQCNYCLLVNDIDRIV